MAKKPQSVQHHSYYSVESENKQQNKYIGDIKSGFPTPVGEFLNESIDLNKYVTLHTAATYCALANGIFLDGDIHDGDLLVIDKSVSPTEAKIVLCYIDGEFTVRRIKMNAEGIWLMPTNERSEAVFVTESNDVRIWGVVTYIIKRV